MQSLSDQAKFAQNTLNSQNLFMTIFICSPDCEATTSFSDSHNDSTVSNHEDFPEPLDQKANFRGTKIARRARSFKDDFFEKISQMRTPTNTISR